MPTADRRQAVSLDEAIELTGRSCFTPLSPTDRIGLEAEFFVIRVDGRGRPLDRVRLHGENGLLQVLDELADRAPWLGRRQIAKGNPVYPVEGGGHLSFEPGAQLEFSSGIHDTATAALEN
jgi:gamma-glutamylcysteine synthetase